MPPGPADVVVVLVAHDGARWLPRTLAGLAASTLPPVAVVGVDTGSRDGSADLLAPACDAVVPLPRTTGYPAAVRAGLVAAPPSRWVWLLHDDSAPAPDALAALLAHADADPSAVLLGPKAVAWDDPRRLVEVGLTVDGDGVLERGLEPGSPDQGQHDAVRDVLAVGTAGALVRRDVLDAVGGLDPALPLGRDDVDLGWRVNGFGGRVVVVPSAVVRHARAVTTGLREPDALGGRSLARAARQQAVQLRLAFAPVLPLAVLGVLVGGLLRALALLLARRPGEAADELAALTVRPGSLRRTRAGARTVPARSLRPLFARRRTRLLRAVTALEERRGRRSADPVPLRQRPGLLLGLGLLVVALLAERSLLPGTGPVLAGGRLLPAPPGATDLWDAYGRAGAPPVLALLAVLAGPLLGSARAAVDVVVLLAVPLAGLSAYGCSAGLVRGRALRAWAAATWALLPVATGAVAAGRLDTALDQVLLPPLLLLGVRLLARDRAPDGGRLAARTGLLLAVLVAVTPLLWVLVAVLLLVGAVGGRLDDVPVVPRLRAAGLALLVPLLVLLPWSAALVRHPSRVLQGPWPAGADLAEPVGGLGLALLHPGGPGLPARLVTAGVVLAALAGPARAGRRRRTAVLGWLTALLALLAAGVLVRLSAGGARVWPGPALQLAAAGLLVAAVVGGEGLRGRLQRSAFGARQLLAGGVAVLAAVTPVLLGLGWVVRGADGPLRRDAAPALPAFARAELAEQPGVRALVLQAGQPLRYAVVGGQGARLGDGPSGVRLDGVVADLASGRGGVPALSTRAVRYVALRGSSPGPAAALDAQAGLVRRGEAPLWQVSAPTARLQVLAPAAAAAARLGASGPDPDLLRAAPPVAVDRTVRAGAAGRLLVLAEPAGEGWTATLAGRPLPPVTAWGWAQAFVLPRTGGRVRVAHDDGPRGLLLAGQALLLLGAVAVAGPGSRA